MTTATFLIAAAVKITDDLPHSNFKYSNLKLSKTTATATDTIAVSVDVTNDSTRDGAEVVQLYVKDVISSVAVPNIQLRGFAKVLVAAGATETVEMQLKVQDLGLWDIGMKYVVEPGEFKVSVMCTNMLWCSLPHYT